MQARPKRGSAAAEWAQSQVCFSPEADALAGSAIVVVGIDAMRHADRPEERALAALPLLLGAHQLTETLVWLGFEGDLSHTMAQTAIAIYLAFALVVLPVLIPAVAWWIERVSLRRDVIVAFGLVGLGVSAVLLGALIHGPFGASIDGRHIAYSVDALSNGGQVTGVYIVATCGALIASSERSLAVLGLLNLVVVPLLLLATTDGFVSLWCFWAAIVSVVIAAHLRRHPRLRRAVRSDPARDRVSLSKRST
jgi:hypothetical protein